MNACVSVGVCAGACVCAGDVSLATSASLQHNKKTKVERAVRETDGMKCDGNNSKLTTRLHYKTTSTPADHISGTRTSE